MDLSGDYFISVSGHFPENNPEQMTIGPYFFGLSIPYSPEYADFSEDHTLLSESAAITGGKMLYPGNKESEAWLFKKSSTMEYIPLWELLVYIGLLLFLCEIVVRKISISKKFNRYIIDKFKKNNEHNETRGYEDLKAIMNKRD